jgi:hypothetical protein
MSDLARLVEALLARHGRLFSAELGLDLRSKDPSVLFQWLCAAYLLGGRIRAAAAEEAAQALLRAGWSTPARMAATTWEERTRLLNRSGYARYDESTSRRFGEMAEMLIERYDGDLRRLREAASHDPDDERRLFKQIKGIGDVRVDIFVREVQLVWNEHYPFADRRALNAAATLGLGDDVRALAGLVDRADFPRLVAALVRCDLARDADAILEEAGR